MSESTRLRYSYRAYPTSPKHAALARAFGCARVVFNDGLRLREDAFAAGLPYIPDAELMHRVITLAKRAPERAWLAEVPNVVLQQAVRDLNRAYRNFFASAKGRRKGRRMRPPRFRSKREPQAIRFTRGKFAVTERGVRLAKIGEVRVRWSRPLPAEPSGVTITLDTAGRYHASFVVEVPETPLPQAAGEVGVDLGLAHFATFSTGEKVENPRWLRGRQRALARAQRALARKQKGSANRAKARRRVARLHARVADARRDFHHQLSTRLIRENQAVCVETLAVAGLKRTRLSKSIDDVGWARFVAMLEYKARLYGRTLIRVDRAFPSSQLCSACGHCDGPKPLHVRSWICLGCGAKHDRDVNAALNILAAGRAAAACGGRVSPEPARAMAGEAGTHRGVA